MMTLYIDFDGVILDTIPVLNKALIDNNVDLTNDLEIREFFSKLDWKKVVETTPQLNDSIECIKRVIKSNRYDEVKVLTHVNSENEIKVKKEYINSYIPNLEVIGVPKTIKKNNFFDNIENSILIDDYAHNLDEWHNAGGISIKFGTTDKESNYPKISRIDQILNIEIDRRDYARHLSKY